MNIDLDDLEAKARAKVEPTASPRYYFHPATVLDLIRLLREAETAKERYAALNHGLRCELAEAQARERERIIRECIPGGSICDPQQIADAVRALGEA